jgi:hypothetical protein
MQTWHTKIQKHIDTTAKSLALCVCIGSMAVIGLSRFFCKSKNTEEVQQPKDYEVPRWTDSDWAQWLENHRDNWN